MGEVHHGIAELRADSAKYLAWQGARSYSYLVIPKAACGSVRAAIASFLKVPNIRQFLNRDGTDYHVDAPTGWSFAFARQPLERAISSWWDKTQIQNHNRRRTEELLLSIWGRYDGLFYPGMSLDAFINSLHEIPLNQAEDHFRPYTEILKREGHPTYLGRLEEPTTWTNIRRHTGLGPLPKHYHRSRNRPTMRMLTPHQRRRLEAYYLQDLELWESL